MIRVFEPWTSPSDILEVNKALIKKQISGSSTYISKLEEKFTQFIGMKYGIAVSNGSVALDLALQTLDLDENDEKMKTMGVVKGGISSFCTFSIKHYSTYNSRQ